ncbi:LysE family translocator [Kitasatospora sp. NPDC101183]|uniref:LysE family translocator n=1 Tax=Kitasatospora sp. NPDC101183 TaxID=3364100 RepID=UPI0037F8EC37
MRPLSVLAYLLAVAPLIATPGTSLALLTHRVSTDGRRAAAPVILGTATGLYVHAALAGLGLSALVMRSSEAFTAIRLAGALYLLALGIRTWRTRALPRPATPRTDRSTYRQALLGNVLNPKAASIFLTLAPQFLSPTAPVLPQFLTLATAQALLLTVWLLLWTPLLTRTTPTLRPYLTRLTAATLITTAVHTAAG